MFDVGAQIKQLRVIISQSEGTERAHLTISRTPSPGQISLRTSLSISAPRIYADTGYRVDMAFGHSRGEITPLILNAVWKGLWSTV